MRALPVLRRELNSFPAEVADVGSVGIVVQSVVDGHEVSWLRWIERALPRFGI